LAFVGGKRVDEICRKQYIYHQNLIYSRSQNLTKQSSFLTNSYFLRSSIPIIPKNTLALNRRIEKKEK